MNEPEFKADLVKSVTTAITAILSDKTANARIRMAKRMAKKEFIVDFYSDVYFDGKHRECFGSITTDEDPLYRDGIDPEGLINKAIKKYFMIPDTNKKWLDVEHLYGHSGFIPIPRSSPIYHRKVYLNP